MKIKNSVICYAYINKKRTEYNMLNLNKIESNYGKDIKIIYI